MKLLVLGGVSFLLMSVAATSTVRSETTIAQATSSTLASTTNVEPFDLVFMAYQGFFTNAGIPSNAGLIDAYHFRRISARDLVKAAVAQNRLPSQAVDNQNYLNAVELHLRNLEHSPGY